MILPRLRRAPVIACWGLLGCGLLGCGLAGCTVYQAAPLAETRPLPSGLGALHHTRPDGSEIAVTRPLSLSDLAALAVLNNPDLVAARAQHDVAAADLLSAGMPPDPSITGGFAALLGGAGTMPSIAGGLTQDIGALITYQADRTAAKAGLAQVDAGILWQEWQVAAAAEQLAVTLTADQAGSASLAQEATVLSSINNATQGQIAQSNQTMADGATSLAALASVQTASDTAQQAAAHDRDQLDALLGLQPGTDIPLAPIAVAPPAPGVVAPAIASLAQRRPDLIALRYGYSQADAKLRAAILSQFLPMSLGATGGRDTTGVISAGPQVTLTLPLFNHNRGAIAAAKATRAMLAAQYQASLAGAAGGAQALADNISLLQTQLAATQAQSRQADAIAVAADKAYAAGELSAPAYAALQSAAGERQRAAISQQAQLQTAALSLATMLGLGLPPLPAAPQDIAP